ncbi:MAG: transglutaminase domain-containing protein [Ruminococcus sp.]
MIKRFFALVLVLSIALGCTACFSDDENNTTSQTETTSPLVEEDDSFTDIDIKDEEKNEYYTPVDITIGYDSLESDDQRDCYKRLVASANEVSDEVSDNGNYPCKLVTLEDVVLTQSEIRLVLSAVKMDNPMLFWLTDNFGYSNTNGYTAMQLYSYETPDKIKSMQNKLMKKVNKFITSVNSGLSEYDREILAHDKVVESCEYADEVKSAQDDYLAFTPYGVLVKGSAVCEGYAKCFQYFLSQLGIKSVTILGKGSKELHMWNAVLIDDCWYYVDPSWDDGKDYERYDYFNITTDVLLSDHTMSGEYSSYTSDEICGTGGETAVNFNLFIPECYSIDANYYVRSASHFTDLYSYDNPDMVNALYDSANRRDEYFHIYIDPLYLEFTNAVDQLFSSGDQLFFTYIDSVNSMYPNNYIDKDNIYIVKKEKLSVVTVKLSYQ